MKDKNISQFKAWFTRYTRGFYSNDSLIQQNIVMKEEHTYRVYQNTTLITTALKLTEDECFLAKICALFHDIGRFEQFKQYRTFNDSKSINHAKLSVEILKKEQVLDLLPQYHIEIIINAILDHNKRELPHKDSHHSLYGKILRDADKLDILAVVARNYECRSSNHQVLTLDLPDIPDPSILVLEDVKNHRPVNFQNVKTQTDLKLLQLSWIYDINFSITFYLLQERKLVKRIVNTLPQTRELQKAKDQILSYLDHHTALK